MCAGSAVASVSLEVISQLELLMVEGELLPAEVDELASLHRVLTACDSDSYGIITFEFEVCFNPLTLSHHKAKKPASPTVKNSR